MITGCHPFKRKMLVCADHVTMKKAESGERKTEKGQIIWRESGITLTLGIIMV
jgi:hypothetical protein